MSRLRYHGSPTTNLPRISIDPSRMGGEPCIRDLRLTVRRVVEAMTIYPDREEHRREYPELEDEDLRQALAFSNGMTPKAWINRVGP
jgi:uncharacterized protein (DUF433 family)